MCIRDRIKTYKSLNKSASLNVEKNQINFQMASLSPKTTVLGKRLAAHLLRRATYHFSPERIDAFAIKTAEEAVDELCDILPSLQFPNGPINWNNGTPIFDEARAVTNFNNGINNFFQSLALYQWRILEMYFDPSIRQKLTVWLDSIWVVGNPEMENPAAHFARWRLLQTFACLLYTSDAADE